MRPVPGETAGQLQRRVVAALRGMVAAHQRDITVSRAVREGLRLERTCSYTGENLC